MTEIRQILSTARTIAVLGVSGNRHKAGYYVPDYLAAQGYRILPVNPRLVGQTMWGEPVVATLAELAEPVDLVDVFRRPEWLPDHEADILALDPRPAVVWFQLGIRSDAVALRLEAAGIEVVQSRCTLADHRALGIGPVG